MLGVRLDTETERRLAAVARRTRRPKSDIAREAVREYLDRHDTEDELERQLGIVANVERNSAAAKQELDELDAMSWRTIDRL